MANIKKLIKRFRFFQTPENSEENEINQEHNNTSVSCIMTPRVRGELPKVDCEPQTQILAIDEDTNSHSHPPRLNRSTSSIHSEDEDSRTRDSLPSADERRPSTAHIITIAHS